MDNDLALLHQKVDTLTEQVAALTSLAEMQQKRQLEFDELKQDMIPIANHMIKLTIDELAEIGHEFEVEDLFFLLKRALRNTHLIMSMMDRLESLMGLTEEAEILGKQVFNFSIEQLDELERKGYFDFAREGWQIIERIVTEFDKNDVRALGDNVVTILTTVRNMTQPEVLALANNAIGAMQEDPLTTKPISAFQLIKELRNPEIRLGMARLLNIVKALANTPTH